MKRNFLIGNGINSNTDSAIFSANNIRDRFYSVLSNTDYSKDDHMLKVCLQNWMEEVSINNQNIEYIINDAYRYVVNNIQNKKLFIGGNNDYRVKKILTEVAIKSIFILDDNFINIAIDEEIKHEVLKYENIYTLNYYEYWDDLNRAKYLHGKIKKMHVDNKTYIDSSECIFAIKEEENKSESQVVYLSDNLMPGNDLFTGGEIELYTELINLDELSIFGVSPYGDTQLLDNIKSIKKKKIFIYEMNEEKIKEWKKDVGETVFLDSMEFINERQKYE